MVLGVIASIFVASGVLRGVFSSTMDGSRAGWAWASFGVILFIAAFMSARAGGLGMRHLKGTDSHGHEYSVWMDLITGREVRPLRGLRAVLQGLAFLAIGTLSPIMLGWSIASLIFSIGLAAFGVGTLAIANARRPPRPAPQPPPPQPVQPEPAPAPGGFRGRRPLVRSNLKYEDFHWGEPAPTIRQFYWAIKLGVIPYHGMTFMDMGDAMDEIQHRQGKQWLRR